MCQLKRYHGTPNTQIDKCIRGFIMRLKIHLHPTDKIIACCCGHKKYPMSIVVEDKFGNHCDLVSGEIIERKRKFYKKDKQGYYYIPEAIKKNVI